MGSNTTREDERKEGWLQDTHLKSYVGTYVPTYVASVR
jgi:hypothetical protein